MELLLRICAPSGALTLLFQRAIELVIFDNHLLLDGMRRSGLAYPRSLIDLERAIVENQLRTGRPPVGLTYRPPGAEPGSHERILGVRAIIEEETFDCGDAVGFVGAVMRLDGTPVTLKFEELSPLCERCRGTDGGCPTCSGTGHVPDVLHITLQSKGKELDPTAEFLAWKQTAGNPERNGYLARL